VVPPGDPRALGSALRGLLDDPEAAAELGARARKRCEAEWSFGAARTALFPLIDRLLERGRRP
jgi:glycosyltransferase involved in cell wall biosynthesis